MRDLIPVVALLFVVAPALVVGCSAKTVPPTQYLLPAEVPRGIVRVDPPLQIGRGRLELAPYLAQPGLVVETDAQQVRSAREHQWAEPLDAGLRRSLRAGISRAAGFDVSADATQRARWDYAVDVDVERFHGTLAGEAVLVARWRVSPVRGKGDPVRYRFSASEPLPRAGYPGLVEAEIALAGQLADAIAASLPSAGSNAPGH